MMTLRAVHAWLLLLGGALVAWIFAVRSMRGMDAGPGTDLGGFGRYVGLWVTMMAAMMLPSAAPMVLRFDRFSTDRKRRALPSASTWVFVAAYLAVWTVYGLLAYAFYRGIHALHLGILDWERGGPYVVATILVLAGVYELTPLKRVCLRHCRWPLHFLPGGRRDGLAGAVRMGGEHGAYCVGCCWGPMIVLFALGVMSIRWMVVVATVIFAQKVLPAGERLARAFAVAFVAAGVWVAASPGSVPGLTQPNSPEADHARMRMMHVPSMPADRHRAPMGGSGSMEP